MVLSITLPCAVFEWLAEVATMHKSYLASSLIQTLWFWKLRLLNSAPVYQSTSRKAVSNDWPRLQNRARLILLRFTNQKQLLLSADKTNLKEANTQSSLRRWSWFYLQMGPCRFDGPCWQTQVSLPCWARNWLLHFTNKATMFSKHVFSLHFCSWTTCWSANHPFSFKLLYLKIIVSSIQFNFINIPDSGNHPDVQTVHFHIFSCFGMWFWSPKTLEFNHILAFATFLVLKTMQFH